MDPVVLLEVGKCSVIAVTRGGEAYGWGCNWDGQLALPAAIREQPVPLRIAALSGRGLRRLACGWRSTLWSGYALAETGAGELLTWGMMPALQDLGAPPQAPQPLQPHAGCLVFPLRCIAPPRGCAAVVDGAGELWCLWKGQGALTSAGLPAAVRVVRASVTDWEVHTVFALTAEGCLWECRESGPSRNITAGKRVLPQWLLPCQKWQSGISLIADVCGGKPRLRLFARIAVRLRLPSDPLRTVLTGYVVLQDYVTGPDDDPFGWPTRPRAEA